MASLSSFTGLGQIFDSWSSRPQAFKVKVSPLRFVEDVKNDLAKVDHHPVSLVDALDGHGGDSFLGEALDDSIADPLDLSVGTARGNQDIVGHITKASKVKGY
jgi:hypothetical protein